MRNPIMRFFPCAVAVTFLHSKITQGPHRRPLSMGNQSGRAYWVCAFPSMDFEHGAKVIFALCFNLVFADRAKFSNWVSNYYDNSSYHSSDIETLN